MKQKITKVAIPTESKLLDHGKRYEYSDSYQAIYTDKNNSITSTDIGRAFFSSAPQWTEHLFTLRNNIVSVFGLKTPDKINNRKALINNFSCEEGSSLGFF